MTKDEMKKRGKEKTFDRRNPYLHRPGIGFIEDRGDEDSYYARRRKAAGKATRASDLAKKLSAEGLNVAVRDDEDEEMKSEVNDYAEKHAREYVEYEKKKRKKKKAEDEFQRKVKPASRGGIAEDIYEGE
jgi:hypothetical protein